MNRAILTVSFAATALYLILVSMPAMASTGASPSLVLAMIKAIIGMFSLNASIFLTLKGKARSWRQIIKFSGKAKVRAMVGWTNVKTALIGTYRARITCPLSCPYFHKGCYGNCGHMKALGLECVGQSVKQDIVAVAVAYLCAVIAGHKAVRLHVLGDFTVNGQDLDMAYLKGVRDYLRTVYALDPSFSFPPLYTYTHCEGKARWIETYLTDGHGIDVVILQSDEDAIVRHHDGRKDGYIECPGQKVESLTCAQCGLCFDRSKWKTETLKLALDPHGSEKGAFDNVG